MTTDAPETAPADATPATDPVGTADADADADAERYPTDSDATGERGVTDAAPDAPGDGETDSSRTRHPYTNDVVALVLLGGLTAMVAAALLTRVDVGTLPAWFRRLYASICLLAAVWAFGQPAVEGLRAFKGK
jgi:hypothetical protein